MWPVYRRNLESSAADWFGFHYEVMSSREAPATSPARLDPQLLLSQWSDLNGSCRGGSGNNPATLEACEQRNVASNRLLQAGYCYGRRGEYGYQMSWHVCEPNSNRP